MPPNEPLSTPPAPARMPPGVVPPRVSRLEMAVGAAALLLVSYWAFNTAMKAAVHSRKTAVVPDLKGKSLSAALDLFSPLGLGLSKEGTEFDASVPIGSILRQYPAPGTVVREGRIIRVVVSEGGRTALTPTLIGLQLRNAEMLLRQNDLLLGEASSAYSLRQEKGTVLAQDPKPESSVEQKSPVNVVVSAGPPPEGVRLMPDFARKSVDEVHRWLTDTGIKATIANDSSSLFPYGIVLSQTPEPDSVLSPATAVSFVVSGKLSASDLKSSEVRTFHYEVPQNGAEALQVRIVAVDRYGEHELFNGTRPGGAQLSLPIETAGDAKIKIYLNGTLIEEKTP